MTHQHTRFFGSSEIFRVRSMDFDFDFGRRRTTDGAQMAIEFRGGLWSPLNLEFREERDVKGKERDSTSMIFWFRGAFKRKKKEKEKCLEEVVVVVVCSEKKKKVVVRQLSVSVHQP